MNEPVNDPHQENLVSPQNEAKGLIVVPMTSSWDFYTSFWATRQGPNFGVKPFLHNRPGFVEDMRQKVTNMFLETGIEWLMMVDNDTVPSFTAEKAVARAESLGAKVVAYPTPFIGSYPEVASNIFIAAEDPQSPGDIVLAGIPWHDLPWQDKDEFGHRKMFEINSAGLGCTLIHRDVLADLMRKAESGEMTDYPFRALFKKGELFYGEDQMFFLRANASEVTVWTDIECWCSHRKLTLINPNLARDYFEGKNGAPDPRINPDAPYTPDLSMEGRRARPAMGAADVLKKVALIDLAV